MNKFLFVLLFFSVIHFRLSAQQFSQYNTGTLYDSFENPSQKAFIPDSSRRIAFNFFVPNFNTDIALSGNAQAALKSRLFLNFYDDRALTTGKQNINYANANLNAYFFMVKLYTNLESDQELGFFAESKFEGRGNFPDESVQLLADNSKFTNTTYSDVFNSHYEYQLYHQIGFSYRENLDRQLSIGIKLGALFGVVANRVNIDHSVINFDRANDRAFLSAAGSYQASFQPGNFTSHDLLPSTRNPGAAVSLGVGYTSEDHYKFQFNLKDLGFIHWSAQSLKEDFNSTGVINGLSQPGAEDSVARTALALVQNKSVSRSFVTPTDARFDASVSHAYWMEGLGIKYTPTIVLSKQLFYTGFTSALVNHFQYNDLVGTLTASYDDMHQFNFGAQFMVKTPNTEFFIGSDRIPQTLGMARSTLNNASSQTFANGAFSGMNFFMGFSFKLGSVIEHQSNTTTIPISEKVSFVKRFWERVTGQED